VAQDADARIVRRSERGTSGAVVDHEHLEVDVLLREHRLERQRRKDPPVSGGHDDADRLRGHKPGTLSAGADWAVAYDAEPAP
jgi:hypothetical protein